MKHSHIKAFGALVKARTMEFVRDRATFFWNLLFPIVLVLGFGIAFSGGQEAILVVGYSGSVPDDFALAGIDGIELVDYETEGRSLQSAIDGVRQHQLDMAMDFNTGQYFLNDGRASSDILRRLLNQPAAAEDMQPVMSAVQTDDVSASADNPAGSTLYREALVTGDAIRYVDWVVPGVIGMNIMMSSLFGVGFVLVRYRKNGVLKRMKATPISSLNFVSAQAVSRLLIVVVSSSFVYLGTNLFLHFTMNGSWFDLFLVTTLASLCMISLGLIFASRLKSEELANGLMNLVTFPMIILSGVFFNLENAPQIVRTIAKIFPLTHFTDASRAIMLDGANLTAILPNITYLGALTLAFLFISSFMFRWE